MQIPSSTFDRFAAACRKVADYNLIKCSSGNMSWRVDDDNVLITASRSWMAEVDREQITVCDLCTGEVRDGHPPSVESKFHLGILRKRPESRVVLHFQSPAATAISCARPEEVDFCVLPEIPFYIGKPMVVPFMLPGTEELANAVITAMREHDMVILQNHGQVTLGLDLDDALQKAVFFEMACNVILSSSNPQPLPQEAIDSLVSMGHDRTGKV